MLEKELILKKLSKIEDKLLMSKMLDKALKSLTSRSVTHSDFLDPYQRRLIEKTLSGCSDFDCIFDGGYTGAERVIAVFRPNFMSIEEDGIERGVFFRLLNIKPRAGDNLSHRDYLGSLMGLGIKREKIGDIIVYTDWCAVVVLKDIADYIKYNLVKIGNTRVDVDVKSIHELQVPEPKVKEISTTVASLRLDCISSAGFGISRSKIAELIRVGKLNLNWETADSPARHIKEGDTISVRGKGRIVLESIKGRTRKDRISVSIKKYI